MNIYYLGPESTYSHIVTRQAFTGPLHALVPARSFGEIFQKVADSNNSVGVIPVENSITSNVHENIDRLFRGDLKIVGEAFLEIHLHLIAPANLELGAVSTILSHPKALEQCSKFLSTFRGAVEHALSTSESVNPLSSGSLRNTALIGSRALAESAGLSILKESIGDIQSNSTRFLFIAQNDTGQLDQAPCNRLTCTFQVRHEPGALVRVLSVLGAAGANLTKIESRPIPGRDWEYLFWVDLEIDPSMTAEVIGLVRDHTLEYHILGCYPTGRLYPS